MLCCSYWKHLIKWIHVNVNIDHLFFTLRSVCFSRGLYTFNRGGQAGTSRLRVAELQVLNKGGKGLIRWMLVLLNEQMMTRLHPRNDHLHKHILRKQQLQKQQNNTHGYSHIQAYGTLIWHLKTHQVRIFNITDVKVGMMCLKAPIFHLKISLFLTQSFCTIWENLKFKS